MTKIATASIVPWAIERVLTSALESARLKRVLRSYGEYLLVISNNEVQMVFFSFCFVRGRKWTEVILMHTWEWDKMLNEIILYKFFRSFFLNSQMVLMFWHFMYFSDRNINHQEILHYVRNWILKIHWNTKNIYSQNPTLGKRCCYGGF